MTKVGKGFGIFFGAFILLALVLYFGFGYALGRALESKGLRQLIGGKTAKILDTSAGYLPLASDGLSVSSSGFLAKASPPRALTEMRAAHLRARCNLGELWRGKWRIDNLAVNHLQAAYGPAAAQLLNRNEFHDPELMPPSKTESPIEVDLRKIDIAHTDLFWGSAPEVGGEFRNVHTNFFPREGKLSIAGSGGTFHQAKWPFAQVQRFKLFYAKPELRIDEGYFTLGGQSTIAVLGNFRFEQPASFDLQLTFARCPVAPFLSETQRSKLEAEFDATTHLQNQMGQSSPRASGSIAFARAILKNIEALQNVANFTGRQELSRLPINQIKADYEWNSPTLTVKNFVLESNGLVVVKGDFTMKEQKIEGEFQLGVTPDLVEKFPGAREEVFKRSADGYLWTDLKVSGRPDRLRDDLKPRLVRAAQNHFAKGLLAPIFKPGQTVIQAIEAL
ncbi:MAG: hypothetical protein M3R29_03550 [Verrucomicrobiota bacterium]|nr:hypothetical protein [Verrucomicrobiota bacterium]